MSRPPSIPRTARRVGMWGAIGLVAGAAFAVGSAQAQSASGTLSSYRTGYGGAGLAGLSSPVSPSLISAGTQYSISDGVNQAGSVGSVFTTQTSSTQTSGGQTSSGQTSGGAGQSYTGVGQGAVSNERAPLAVVEATAATAADVHGATASSTPQTNPAATTARAPAAETAPSDLVLNGKLNLDGGQ